MAGRQYRFRNFSLDPAARELRQGDALVSLPASALDCLVYLIEHRERAVGRDELIAAVWGRADVADTLLAQTVMRVRRTLGDSGSDGAIRTIARFGYRWVEDTAEVEIDAETPDAASPSAAEAAAPPSTGVVSQGSAPETGTPAADTRPLTARHPPQATVSASRWITLAALALIAAAGAAFWLVRSMRPSVTDVAAESGIVANTTMPALVLPAEVPDTPDWRWLRVGLMDLIGNRLREGGLPTAPSETVLAMQASDTSDSSADGGLRITPQARIDGGEWRIRLALARGEERATVEAASDDVLQAARAAADLLLIRLGHAPPPGGDLSRPLALDELLQRTRAAILGDQLDLARALIEHAPEPLRTAPEIDLRLAQIDAARGDDAAAERRLLQSLDRVAPDNAALRGRMLSLLGTMRLRLGAIDDAFAAYGEAITLLQSASDPLALAAAHSGRAAVVSERGDVAAAAADLARAKVEMEAAGDALGIAQIDMNLGVIELQQHRPVQAIGILRSAETRIANLGAREELAYVRYALLGALLQALDYDEAAAVASRFWPPDVHTANARLRWQLMLARSILLVDTGRLTDAEALLQRIERESDTDADASVRLQARAVTVLARYARGLHEEVVAAATPLLDTSLTTADPHLYAGISHARLRSLRASGRIDEAATGVQMFADWAATRADPWRALHATLAQAEHRWAVRQDAAALAELRTAYDQALALAIPEELVATAGPYVDALLERGATDEAATVVGRIAAWSDRDLRAAWAQARLYRAQNRIDAWQRSTERLLVLAGERALPQARID